MAARSEITLPFSFGTLSTESPKAFVEDLFLSSTGTIVLTIYMLLILVMWRTLIDDGEDHEKFIEKLKEEELERKWAAHNAKWGKFG